MKFNFFKISFLLTTLIMGKVSSYQETIQFTTKTIISTTTQIIPSPNELLSDNQEGDEEIEFDINKYQCGFGWFTINYISCIDRNGLLVSSNRFADCELREVCFHPTDGNNNKFLPDVYKAKDVSECIEIEGNYYCAADLITNVPCPDCTFSEFVKELKKVFGNKFNYNNINTSTTNTTSIILPPEHYSKFQCVGRMYFDDSDEKKHCEEAYGLFFENEFYPNCNIRHTACFYPEEHEFEYDEIAAEMKYDCIYINDEKFCSVRSNIPCTNCTFTEMVEKIKNTFEDYFNYEVIYDSNIDNISDEDKYICPLQHYESYSPVISKCLSYSSRGYLLTSYLSPDCQLREVCLHPVDDTKLFPDGYIAKDISECIEMEGEYYCAADLVTNIPCPNCTFSEFVIKLKKIFGRYFQYKAIDASTNISIDFPLKIEYEDTENVNIEYIRNFACQTGFEWSPPPSTKCNDRYGYTVSDYKFPDCKRREVCFHAANSDNNEFYPDVYKAKDVSECIEIDGNYYCTADLITNIPCPDCTFNEFVKEVKRLFDDRFNYNNIDISTTNTTSIILPQEHYGKFQCVGRMYFDDSDEKKHCMETGGLPFENEFYPDCHIRHTLCFYPEGKTTYENDEIVAKKRSECIVIKGTIYCSAKSNIPCTNCTFSELLEKIKITFEDYVKYLTIDENEVDDSKCAGLGDQCGGKNYEGPTCCKIGLFCENFGNNSICHTKD